MNQGTAPWCSTCTFVLVPKGRRRGCGGRSPLLRGEDEFPKLQVPQHNGRLVTVGNGRDNLLEEPGGLFFPQPLPASHVGVHVPKVFLKEDVGLGFPKDHLHDASDVSVRWQLDVRPDFVLVVFNGKHLQREGDPLKRQEKQRPPPKSQARLQFSVLGLGQQQAPFIHPLISAAPPPAASAVVNTPNQQPLGVWVSKYTTGYHIEGLKELSSIYAPTFHEATSSREQSPKVPNPLQAFVVRRQSCWNWLIEGSPPPTPRSPPGISRN